MDIRKIKKLIELLEESGIAEIEIKEGEEGVRISRMPPAGYAAAHALAGSRSSAHRGNRASAGAGAVSYHGADCRATPKSNEQRGHRADGRDVLFRAVSGCQGVRRARR